jgi:DNA-binding transcriptional LysR family regulator
VEANGACGRAHRLIEPVPLDWRIRQWDVMMNHIDSMNEHANLSGVDLNLLHVFDALMTERSVTRAGKQVGLSQSATSNALARLRALFGDALFVKTPAGMIPTSRAQALAGPIRIALDNIASAVRPQTPFDPARSHHTFTLGMSDYVEFTLLPALVRVCAKIAPGVTLNIRAVDRVLGWSYSTRPLLI